MSTSGIVRKTLGPFSKISPFLWKQIYALLYFSIKNYPIVRLDTSISNTKDSFNFYIDIGNSRKIIQKNRFLILSVLKTHVSDGLFIELQEFILFFPNEVSLGITLKDDTEMVFNLVFNTYPAQWDSFLIERYFKNKNIDFFNIAWTTILLWVQCNTDHILMYKCYYKNISFSQISEYTSVHSYKLLFQFAQFLWSNSESMFLIRYIPNRKSSLWYKLFLNINSYDVYLDINIIEVLVHIYFFRHEDLISYIWKRISSIASTGWKNLELYLDVLKIENE